VNTIKIKVLFLVSVAGLATVPTGCGTAPSIGISDARVVGAPQLAEIQRDIAARADLLSSNAALSILAGEALKCTGCLDKHYGHRRFVAESFSSLWMNPKRDSKTSPLLQSLAMENQRTAIAARTAELDVQLAALTAAQSRAAGDQKSEQKSDAKLADFTSLAKVFIDEAKKLAAKSPVDSPTDALDRWHQISMWYFVRHITARHDMRRDRASAPAATKLCVKCREGQRKMSYERFARSLLLGDVAKSDPTKTGWQYVVLVFEVHVNPGSQPNRAVGVRLRPVKSYSSVSCAENDLEKARAQTAFLDGWDPKSPPPRLLITELFPTRVYDLEEAALLDARSMTVSGKAGTDMSPGVPGPASISSSAEKASMDQRRFLTRTGKQASFADAATGSFGWDFYPSNFQQFDKGLPEAMFSFVWGQHPGGIKAYLEAGGRTCVAFALVDAEVKAVIFEVTQVVKDAPPLTNLETEPRKRLGYVMLPLETPDDRKKNLQP